MPDLRGKAAHALELAVDRGKFVLVGRHGLGGADYLTFLEREDEFDNLRIAAMPSRRYNRVRCKTHHYCKNQMYDSHEMLLKRLAKNTRCAGRHTSTRKQAIAVCSGARRAAVSLRWTDRGDNDHRVADAHSLHRLRLWRGERDRDGLRGGKLGKCTKATPWRRC